MGLFSRFEGKMEDTFEGAADKMSNSPISPVQIIKKAEKQMRREKMVSAGKQYAPTLYTVLVNADDDQRLFGFYPTLAGETETRLEASATEDGLVMDGQPLVRFIVDESLKHGKFDVIAEVVSAPIIEQLRAEEMQRYGMNAAQSQPSGPQMQAQKPAQPGMPSVMPGQVPAQSAVPMPQVAPGQADAYAYDPQDPFAPNPAYAAHLEQQHPLAGQAAQEPYAQAAKPPLPYVPQEEIDYSLHYGEYTFDSRNFEDYNREIDDNDQQVSLNDEQVNMLNTPFDQDGSSADSRTDCSVEELFAQAHESSLTNEDESDLFMQSESQQDQYQPYPQQASPDYAQTQPEHVQPDYAQAQAQYQQQAQAQYQQQAQAQAHYGQTAYAQAGYPQPGYPQNGYPTPQQYAQSAYPQGYPQSPQYAQEQYAQAQAQQYGQPQQQFNQPQYAAPQQRYGAYGAPATSAFVGGAGYARQNQAGPQVAVRAHLMDTTTHRTYDLAAQRVLLGRERTCNIIVNDINASRTHAEIHFEPQGVWVITDLGSTNGTLVNGSPITRRGLQDGDRITLGITDFIFSLR